MLQISKNFNANCHHLGQHIGQELKANDAHRLALVGTSHLVSLSDSHHESEPGRKPMFAVEPRPVYLNDVECYRFGDCNLISQGTGSTGSKQRTGVFVPSTARLWSNLMSIASATRFSFAMSSFARMPFQQSV